jgi:hypothetical protein
LMYMSPIASWSAAGSAVPVMKCASPFRLGTSLVSW